MTLEVITAEYGLDNKTYFCLYSLPNINSDYISTNWRWVFSDSLTGETCNILVVKSRETWHNATQRSG